MFLLSYAFLWFPWGREALTWGIQPAAGLAAFAYLLAQSARCAETPQPILAA
jgi:hypothetical protein